MVTQTLGNRRMGGGETIWLDVGYYQGPVLVLVASTGKRVIPFKIHPST